METHQAGHDFVAYACGLNVTAVLNAINQGFSNTRRDQRRKGVEKLLEEDVERQNTRRKEGSRPNKEDVHLELETM